MAMTMKMREQTSSVLRLTKVDDQYAAARSQNTPDFARTLLTRFARQMMEHHRAQYDIELCIRKWQRFRDAVLE